jgi:hypothetical protein
MIGCLAELKAKKKYNKFKVAKTFGKGILYDVTTLWVIGSSEVSSLTQP